MRRIFAHAEYILPQPSCGGSLRRQRRFYAQILMALPVFTATLSPSLQRHGLNRLAALDPPKPVVRYERATPSEVLHLDTKSLAVFSNPVSSPPAIVSIATQAPHLPPTLPPRL
jgi:hypothetical protein